jgi:hypothetical protein
MSNPNLLNEEEQQILSIHQKHEKEKKKGIYAESDGLIQSLHLKYKHHKIGTRAAKILPFIMSAM